MEKTTAGLLGMIAGLATMGTAEAASHPPAPAPVTMQVASYADLLAPIPNAKTLLQASDAVLHEKAKADAMARVQLVQDYYDQGPGYGHHHHHHHHHHYYPPPPPPPYYGHHHHHHHHSGVTIVVPGIGIVHSN